MLWQGASVYMRLSDSFIFPLSWTAFYTGGIFSDSFHSKSWSSIFVFGENLTTEGMCFFIISTWLIFTYIDIFQSCQSRNEIIQSDAQGIYFCKYVCQFQKIKEKSWDKLFDNGAELEAAEKSFWCQAKYMQKVSCDQ